MNWTPFQRAVIAIVAVVCLVSIAVAAWGVAKWGFARAGADVPGRGITVSDRAEVKAKPDVAYVTLGVVTKNREAGPAARTNAAKTRAIIDAIVRLDVPKSEIKTVDFSVDPQVDYRKSTYPIVGYTVSNSVSIKLKALDRIGKVIDAAMAAGANSVQGVRFDVLDKTNLREEALKQAAQKAQGKARAIAEALGAGLGKMISASETVDYYSPSLSNYSLARVALTDGGPTPIVAGQTKVSAQVKVVYAIR